MMRLRVLLVMLTAVFAGQLKALPTMIRLGYVNCAACHVAPQGGGLLNAYGEVSTKHRACAAVSTRLQPTPSFAP
jgi:hypothetical protein